MTDVFLYATIEAAAAYAARLLGSQVPGAAVYLGDVTVSGHHRGWRVVLASQWPDQAWQGRAQHALSAGEGQRIECRVCMVLRKPVNAPQELAPHMFIVGHMRATPANPPAVQ